MRKIKCVETEKVYRSIKLAACENNVTSGMILHVLKGRQKTAAGFTWVYIDDNDLFSPLKEIHIDSTSRMRYEQNARR